MDEFNFKRVADPVHKTIGLSQLEVEIIDTAIFQRLRKIKQLGLAYYVYPGADFSRFEHSIGACHLAGRVLDHLHKNGFMSLDSHIIQQYRLAALLHDLGHYPFSHVVENAIKNFYASSLIKEGEDDSDTENSLEHTGVGKEILLEDTELNFLLQSNNQSPDIISSIFNRENPTLDLQNLVSSDLDVDRIDFLLRTSLSTGLPYGVVDIDYLFSQLRLDDQHSICYSTRAIRTIDHLLLSRYFDRLQIAFHKTVTALELVLSKVVDELLKQNSINWSAQSVKDLIKSGEWKEYDDDYLMTHIRELNSLTEDPVLRVQTNSIIKREPPKLVAEMERFAKREDQGAFQTQLQLITDGIQKLANKFDIDEKLWYLWNTDIAFTKSESHVPATFNNDPDLLLQAPLILDRGASKPIFDYDGSLMSILSDSAFYGIRIYVHLTEENLNKRNDISSFIVENYKIPWK